MSHFIPIPLLVLTVTLLLRAVWRDDNRQIYLFKPASTLLVVAVCLLSLLRPNVNPTYTWALLAGLLFSLAGDVALMFPSERAFLLGVASFLLAQVVYALTFALRDGLHRQQLGAALALAVIGCGFYIYIYRYLGKMRVPVLIYAVAISCMALMAVGTLYSPAFSRTQGWLVTVGAILFYVSDMILASNKFAHPFRWGRLLNLSAYYSGQLLIALSAAYALAT